MLPVNPAPALLQLPKVIQRRLLLTKDCAHAPGTAAAALSWSLLLALHQLGREGGHGAESRGQGGVQALRQLLLVGHVVLFCSLFLQHSLCVQWMRVSK